MLQYSSAFQAASLKRGYVIGTFSLLSAFSLPLAAQSSQQTATYAAQQDTTFRRGSGVTLARVSSQQIENLAVLGRVWGFAKYYHPAIAEGRFNLDSELFRLLPKVLATKNPAERSQLLSAWLTRLGPVPACATCAQNSAKPAKQQADLAWLTDPKQLSPAL
ncbi:MAG TPA: hypothetical protein VF598_01305, partial [Hymenobacter sp.]